MKKLFFLFLSVALIVSCGEKTHKVLLFITNDSRDLELMITKEVLVMKETIKGAGFEVVISTLSGKKISVDSILIEPDLKLHDVNISDYSGFIFPCMAPPWENIHNPDVEIVTFIEEISTIGKPMAAQTLSVANFAKAGVLSGKKYAFTIDPDTNEYPYFQGGIYNGDGVIQDGNIITSGTCPWKTREYGKPDGTYKLTHSLINTIRENIQ